MSWQSKRKEWKERRKEKYQNAMKRLEKRGKGKFIRNAAKKLEERGMIK